jgi:hypothetical protein
MKISEISDLNGPFELIPCDLWTPSTSTPPSRLGTK